MRGKRGNREQEQPASEQELVSTRYYDLETLPAMAQKVMAEGFVPAEVLKEQFGASKFTQGIAVLFRQFRVFREVRRPFGSDNKEVLGYEWAHPKFSQPQIKKMPRELGFLVEMVKAIRPKYADYEVVEVPCRWTNHVIASLPVEVGPNDVLHVFERDGDGNVLVPAYCLRAMAKTTLQMIGKESSIAFKIGFTTIRVPNPDIKVKIHPIIDDRGQGLGLKKSETLPPGTEFTITAYVPTTALSVSDYVRMLAVAGSAVRLSPARHTGYGDFIVLV